MAHSADAERLLAFIDARNDHDVETIVKHASNGRVDSRRLVRGYTR